MLFLSDEFTVAIDPGSIETSFTFYALRDFEDEGNYGPVFYNCWLDKRNVTRRFGSGATEVVAVHDVSLTMKAGEVVLIMGPSGSGKTTLLSMLGGLLKPSNGRIQIGTDDLTQLDERRLPNVR
jgi:ABC-type glutathione transport system ATPase component